jgi:hypothetical protein
MIKALAMTLLIVSFLTAPAAAADPQILVPGCTSGQVPQPGVCAASAEEEVVEEARIAGFEIVGFFPGANPGVPPGPLPLDFPVVLPLGVTPFNVPVNLPLGPTPPSRFPFQP